MATDPRDYSILKDLPSKGKVQPQTSWFLKTTAILSKPFSFLGKGAKFTPEEEENFRFLNLKVSAQEFYATFKALLIFGTIAGIAIGFSLFQMTLLEAPPVSPIFLYILAGIFSLGPMIFSVMYLGYPKSEVEMERMRAIAYVPEIINYLVMSMRVRPNLEKAIEFAAAHGKGKIAEEMKDILWDLQVGKYGSAEEALDKMAYKWGEHNDDFKHALMLIRSSTLETDAGKRDELLEKANTDVLEGSKEKMNLYARKLQQPTVYLYYFGILLPLMLAIMLPLAGAFANMPIAKFENLVLIYNIGVPLFVYIYGTSILGNRPPTYVPPEIPEDFPGLPKKGQCRIKGVTFPYKIVALLAFVAVFGGALFLDTLTMTNQLEIGDSAANGFLQLTPKIPFEIQTDMETAMHFEFKSLFGPEGIYGAFGIYFGLISLCGLLIAIGVSISVYLYCKYVNRYEVQKEIREMEAEFKDAIYVLASRLGEGKPMEDALKHTQEFLPKSKIGKRVFSRILYNVTAMGMTLEGAIFDPVFGAMRDFPSTVVQSGMKVLVDASMLGVQIAARSLMSLSMQLRNAQKTNAMLNELLQDVTMMLKTMATFIGPIVLGVVASLQKMVMSGMGKGMGTAELDLSKMGDLGGMSSLTKSMSGIGDLFNAEKMAANSAPPHLFMLVMGIYLLEIALLLCYINAQIEDSNNKLHAYISISKNLPIAAIIFSLVAYFSATMF